MPVACPLWQERGDSFRTQSKESSRQGSFRGSARAFGFGNGACSPECGLPVRPSRAGMTTEAIACGTPVVFDLSRGMMPQESNNLNFWKTGCERSEHLSTVEIAGTRIAQASLHSSQNGKKTRSAS